MFICVFKTTLNNIRHLGDISQLTQKERFTSMNQLIKKPKRWINWGKFRSYIQTPNKHSYCIGSAFIKIADPQHDPRVFRIVNNSRSYWISWEVVNKSIRLYDINWLIKYSLKQHVFFISPCWRTVVSPCWRTVVYNTVSGQL